MQSDRPKKRIKNNHTDFVNDGLPTNEIRSIVKNIREDIKQYVSNNDEDIMGNLEKKYPFFAKRYPMLFAMACKKDDFDCNSLEYFLEMRDNIIANKITSEEASKEVGEKWFNKYVDLSKSTPKDDKSI